MKLFVVLILLFSSSVWGEEIAISKKYGVSSDFNKICNMNTQYESRFTKGVLFVAKGLIYNMSSDGQLSADKNSKYMIYNSITCVSINITNSCPELGRDSDGTWICPMYHGQPIKTYHFKNQAHLQENRRSLANGICQVLGFRGYKYYGQHPSLKQESQIMVVSALGYQINAYAIHNFTAPFKASLGKQHYTFDKFKCL